MTAPRTIVSMTSFPAAIPYAAQAVRFILEGSMLPDKVVLYLDTQHFPDGVLPQEIEAIKEKNPIFEVRFDPAEIRSYKKLIPALRDFPHDVIITVDDDILYHTHLVRDLVRVHKKFPDAIVAHRARRIRLGVPYRKWHKYKWYDFILRRWHFDHRAMQTGVGGVLYPPGSLDGEMLSEELFMSAAPTNDDVWFWAAAVSKGTYVVPVPFGRNKPHELGKPDAVSLQKVNLRSDRDMNRIALEKILESYPAIRQKLLK